MAKTSLKKDAAYVYAGYFLRYASLLILIPYYGRVLGPVGYGQVLAAMSLMGIVWIIVNYGFSNTGARDLATAANQEEIDRIFMRQIMARFVLTPVGIAIGIGGTYFSPLLSSAPLFGVMATILGLLSAFNLGWFFQGLRQFRRSMTVEALAYPLNVLFVLLSVRSPEDGIYALVALVASAVICTAIAYALAFRQVRFHEWVFVDALAEIKNSSTLFLNAMNAMIMITGSTYLLSLLSTPEQVGYFGAAERLIAFGLAMLGPASQILMPSIAHHMKHDESVSGRLIKYGLLLELAYGLCVMMGGVLLSPFLLPLILGNGFVPSVLPFQILVCLFPFAAFRHAFGNYVLIPQKKECWLLLAFTIGNVVNLAIAFVAAGYGGATGMAAARLAGEIVIAAVLLAVALRLKMLPLRRLS